MLESTHSKRKMSRLEYVWIDGYNLTRSKIKYLPSASVMTLKDIPEWNYDGSSTGQAITKNSEIILKPVRLYPSPFAHSDYLVLCDTWSYPDESHGSNNRVELVKLMGSNPQGARYGFEQEFFLVDQTGTTLFADKPQKDYYCGVGANNALGRECVETAMDNCIKAGLNITGMNAEVAPGQWELQIDDMGLAACDGLWMLRYILTKTAERYNLGIDLHPKPLLYRGKSWNGSGCHANFSTYAMRGERLKVNETGYDCILKAIHRLAETHTKDMMVYGEDNQLRLTGSCETSGINTFTWGVGDRSASIRIPQSTELTGCGYFEDRRPASNCDPYLVASVLYGSAN
jgi:glutamine synthetase